MQSMQGMKFYVLFFGTIILLWTIVTLFGHGGHPAGLS